MDNDAINGKTTGLVSTVIPAFNRSEMLKEAVDSVLQQDYRPIEIIIIDDGSTDDTREVALELANTHSEIRVFSQSNQGPGVARENGRLQASGEYIQYLDSDDLLLPNKFSSQIFAFERKPDAQICYGKEARFTLMEDLTSVDWSKVKPIKSTGEINETIFPKILEVNSLWGTSVPLWRSALTDKMGAWLPLLNEEDIEYDARAGSYGVKLVYVDEFIAIQRVHDQHLSSGGTTDPKKLIDILEARKHILKHALLSGLTVASKPLQRYSKSAFLLARMFAKQGMRKEMLLAMELSEKALGKASNKLVCYRHVCRFLGPKLTQNIFTVLEKIR